LVREALAGRGVGRLRAALQQSQANAPVDPPAPSVAGAAEALAPPTDAGALLEDLVRCAHAAQDAWQGGDTGEARSELTRAQAKAVMLLDRLELPPVESPPAFSLPSVHRSHLLVVDGAGDAGVGPRLAGALGVDHATGRLLAVCRHPLVARRAEDRGDLGRLALAVRQEAGLAAEVVTRDDLLAVAAPRMVLRSHGLDGLEVTTQALWSVSDVRPDALPRGEPADAGGVVLAVPGEVVVRRYRATAGRRGKDPAIRDSGERRVGVLDLHAEGAFFRVVEGITDFAGLPGHHASSARLALRGLVESLGERWPAARVLGRRVCQPGDRPVLREGEADTGALEATGWPAWEEHTRLCRLLFLGAG